METHHGESICGQVLTFQSVFVAGSVANQVVLHPGAWNISALQKTQFCIIFYQVFSAGIVAGSKTMNSNSEFSKLEGLLPVASIL